MFFILVGRYFHVGKKLEHSQAHQKEKEHAPATETREAPT
jgi:hypothetical protein